MARGENKPVDHYHNMLCEKYPIDCYWMGPHVLDQVPSAQHKEADALGNNLRNQFDKRDHPQDETL